VYAYQIRRRRGIVALNLAGLLSMGLVATDGALNLVAHSMNIALAAAGNSNRARIRPWISLVLAIGSAVRVGVATKYLLDQMPKVDRAWCPYCVIDAAMHLATFALPVPEAARALRRSNRKP
jgi:uncharacterized membrane protein